MSSRLLLSIAAAGCLLAGFGWWFSRSDAGALAPAVPSVPETVTVTRIVFSGGLACEGREEDMPLSAWQLTCRSQSLRLDPGESPSVELPPGPPPARIGVRVPGWSGVEIALPPADENGCCYLHDRVLLRREVTDLTLSVPRGGTDYDTAEIVWVRALDDEPLALPLGRSALIPLDSPGTKRLPPLPTGIYRCTVKGRNATSVRDFDLIAELALCSTTAPTGRAISLPPSLSRTYVGFAGSAADPQRPGKSTGFFCGIKMNVRESSGELLLSFLPLEQAGTLRFGDLRPRPDTVWPISNVFLEDPVTLAFDCPLSHADYRMFIHAADGRVTLHPELIFPDDARQQDELLGRMRNLIEAQARNAARNPERFDPLFPARPVSRLPNYENLMSREHFVRHLSRLSRTAVQAIELGAQVTVQQDEKDLWSVRVSRGDFDSARPLFRASP